jgi:hypothetical protein
MKFHEVVGRFDSFMRELDAVCRRDHILDKQIRQIARRHEDANKQQPYTRSLADSARRMEEFIAEARQCLEARAAELEAPSLKKAN